ncbi:MAG: hypothetical protein N2115_04190, partial [bacterium]|nr:hypothetical protein [bacterium]
IYPAREPVFSKRSRVEISFKAAEGLPEITRKPVSPISFSSAQQVFDVSGEKIGRVIHSIIYEISNNKLVFESHALKDRTMFFLKKMKVDVNIEEVEMHLANLEKPEIKKIILPNKNGYSEIQFLVEINGDCVFGIIDRVIFENGICKIYDFKTRQKPEIEEADIKQLTLYREGINKLFSCKKIQTFIVFTFCGIIKEVKT